MQPRKRIKIAIARALASLAGLTIVLNWTFVRHLMTYPEDFIWLKARTDSKPIDDRDASQAFLADTVYLDGAFERRVYIIR